MASNLYKNRIYIAEDGRSKAGDEHNCTTVSAIKYLGKSKYTQYVYHNSSQYGIKERTIIYDSSKKGTEGDMGTTNRSFDIVTINDKLKDYLKNGIWKWYFTSK